MRLWSLGVTVTTARRSAVRFPFVLVSAAVAAVAGVLFVGHSTNDLYPRILFSATLGIPLFIALTTWAERQAGTARPHLIVGIAGTIALAGAFLAWPYWSDPVRMLRYLQLALVCHLLVAFLPFVGRDEPNGFWQYNRILFLRFLTAVLYAGTLFVGIALALLALDRLFGVHVQGEAYGRLWMIIAFVFHPWFFVGGIPEDLDALEGRRDYPYGLRVFTQYVLLPLVALYVVILTAYLVKVIGTASWTSGWIGYLVSCVSVLGILAWLLVRPLEDLGEHRWVQAYTRWFYLAIVPSLAMLWLAIGKRIAQYGVTEPRYFLTILSLWVAGIAVYFTVRRSRNIKLIPASLCVVAIVTFLGPWGAFRVSERSQVHRLRTLFTRNEILRDGQVTPASREPTLQERQAMSDVLRYLIETHGTGAIDPWFGDSLARIDTIAHSTRPSNAATARTDVILASLGIVSLPPSRGGSGYVTYSYGPFRPAIPLAGYDYALTLSVRPDTVVLSDGLRITVPGDSGAISVVRGDSVLASLPLATVFAEAAKRPPRPADRRARGAAGEPLAVSAEGPGASLRLYVWWLNGRNLANEIQLTGITGELLVRVK